MKPSFEPTAEQMQAICAMLGPARRMDEAALREQLRTAFVLLDAAETAASMPSASAIAEADRANAEAFAAVRAALALPGNGLSAGRRAAIEAKLGVAQGMLDAHRVKADVAKGFGKAFGQRPAARGAKHAAVTLALIYRAATGKKPTISTDPITRVIGGPFVDFARVVCGAAGVAITDSQLDKALRGQQFGFTARAGEKKTNRGGMTPRRDVRTEAVTSTTKVTHEASSRQHRTPDRARSR